MDSTSFQLIGIRLPHKTTNENGQSMQDCGQLWQRFEQEKIFDQIPNKVGNEVYAVYFEYEGDHTQPFSYFIGAKVEARSTPPAGLDSLDIPGQTYEKVVAKGQMPACIGAAWRSIWESDINRAFGYDLECYDERSYDWSNAEVDIFLSKR